MDEATLTRVLQAFRPPPNAEKKLPAFSSGLPDDWVAWKATFKNVANLKAWEEDAKKNQLVAAMEGNAVRAVSHIDPAHNPARLNQPYTSRELMDAYDKTFMPVAASHLALTQYNMAKQGAGEAILSWHTRLRELFTRAYPAKADHSDTDEDLINKFVLGLAHPVVRDRTWDSHPYTFSLALETATSKAAGVLIMRQTAGFGRGGGSNDGAVLGITETGAVADLAALDGAGGGNPARGGRPLECFVCRSRDHLKRDCPDRAKGRRGGGGGSSWRGRGRSSGGRGNFRSRGGRFTPRHINALTELLDSCNLEEETASGN